MRRLRQLALLVPLLCTVGFAGACNKDATGPLPPGGKHVLFIGNSLTYYNDLPKTIADLAHAVRDTPLVYRTIAKPNYALEDHWHEGVGGRIAAEPWELVVMQQGPSSVLENRQHLIRWTDTLNRAVQRSGGRSALFMVWPAIQNASTFDAVRQSYRLAAQQVGGMFIPAGEAWRAAAARIPSLGLYAGDGFHPSDIGTYMTAIVHFEMFYNRPATDLPDTAIVNGKRVPLDPPTVRLMQEAAHETVLLWGIR